MIGTVGKHVQVLMESPESVARREQKPRARRKYALVCTCKMKRQEFGHCIHTLALLKESVRPERWRDITIGEPLTGNGVPVSSAPEKSRLDLCREIEALKARIAELDASGGAL